MHSWQDMNLLMVSLVSGKEPVSILVAKFRNCRLSIICMPNSVSQNVFFKTLPRESNLLCDI